MNRLTNKATFAPGADSAFGRAVIRDLTSSLAKVLDKLGILREDTDYHLIRASMVIIFFFFGYQKWFQYEASRLIPYISNGPLIFWLYPVFGVHGAVVFGRVRMDVRDALVPRILEQEFGHPRSARLNYHLHNDCHHHPLHARWLGCIGRRVPGHDRQRAFSYERCRASCRIILSAEAGCNESIAFRQRKARSQRMGTVPLSRQSLWQGTVRIVAA